MNKNVLVIGELNDTLCKVESYAKLNLNYSFEHFSVTYPNDIIYHEENFLDQIRSSVQRNDVIIFSKTDSELCLKMILAAMMLTQKKNLIVIQNFLSKEQLFHSDRILSLIKVSEVNFALVDFTSDPKQEPLSINVIQNNDQYSYFEITQDQFNKVFIALLRDVSKPINTFNPNSMM